MLSAVICCGPEVADEKIIVNPNGVDVEKFRSGIGGSAVRNELGVGERRNAGWVRGNLWPWHGVLTLAEAITMLPEDSGVRFLLVGAGRFRDEVERIMSRNAGRERQVISPVMSITNACRLCLMRVTFCCRRMCRSEDGSEFFGSPTKLFEYMAMGKGIVASRLGQIGEVLADEETALLVEPGNARELSKQF